MLVIHFPILTPSAHKTSYKGHEYLHSRKHLIPLHFIIFSSYLATMVLKLYGFDISTCTKRVAVVLHEKKIPFEFHELDFPKKEHKSPEYLAKQPFGQAPYLVTSLKCHWDDMLINQC